MEDRQKEIALNLLEDFRKESNVMNQGVIQPYQEFDKERMETLLKVKELLELYLNDKLKLEEFKTKVDSLNKRNPYWGFRGINGQMFFNMLYRGSSNKEELNKILKNVLKIPQNINELRIKINSLIDYIKSFPQEKDKRKSPKLKSILYFLSYFWQIQDPIKYPVFYTSLEQTFVELNFLEQKEDLTEYYKDFFEMNNELLKLFLERENNANLWFVEHVFWTYYIKKQEVEEPSIKKEIEAKVGSKVETLSEFIPPVISDLISLSLNDSSSAEFERKTAMLFKMLGFDVELYGQGKGRTVDVIARSWLSKPPYLILIDCKARSKKDFRLNAGEERTVIEYIKNFLSNYPRDRNIETHYLIISSGFKDEDKNIRRKIKSETNVDISFITIEALLFLLVQKLQNWDFDVERMREIFQIDGLISKDLIQDTIGR